MPSILLDFLIWLQAAGTAPGAGGGGGGGGGSPLSGDGGMGCAMQAGLFGVMMVVFYFFLLRPERKRREEHEELINSLRKGTKVRTSGGILGEVVTVNDDELVLQIADRVRINVLRSNVSTVESVRKEAKAAESSEKKADSKADKKKSSKKDDAEAQDGA
ncbi:MAG: preprotein translocase subunit YajC [Sandaracinaceae bacterium]